MANKTKYIVGHHFDLKEGKGIGFRCPSLETAKEVGRLMANNDPNNLITIVDADTWAIVTMGSYEWSWTK